MPGFKLTAQQCVRRLVRLGFEVTHASADLTHLRRAHQRVEVPNVTVVAPAMLDTILRTAGVGAEFFQRAASGVQPRLRVGEDGAQNAHDEPRTDAHDAESLRMPDGGRR